jgi:hypothetical protein
MDDNLEYIDQLHGGVLNLRDLDERYVYATIRALYEFNDFDTLVLWSRFFLGYYMEDIRETFGMSANKQRILYEKYKRICNSIVEKTR